MMNKLNGALTRPLAQPSVKGGSIIHTSMESRGGGSTFVREAAFISLAPKKKMNCYSKGLDLNSR